MNPELAKVVQRIQKLLAIAQDARANPHEASAAAGQAEKLMRKFQLDNEDLIREDLRKNHDALTTITCRADAITNGTKAKQVPPWASFLALGVARLNDCGCTKAFDEKFGACIKFYGYSADAQVASYIYDYLVQTINRLAFAYRKSADYLENGRGVLTDYRKGVVQGILQNINAQIKEREATQNLSSGTALVLVKQDAIVQRFGNVFSTKRTRSSTVRSSTYSAGKTDGNAVDINRRGIGHNPVGKTLMIGN